MALTPDDIAKFLSPLDPRLQEVLKVRFGLDRGEPRTLEETAEHFGLSVERIRQLEARGMAELQTEGLMQEIAEYLANE